MKHTVENIIDVEKQNATISPDSFNISTKEDMSIILQTLGRL